MYLKITPAVLLLCSFMFLACSKNEEETTLLEDSFIRNGDFEQGEDHWLFFTNGGTVSIDTSLSNGKGSNSVKISTNGSSNPAIKKERIGIGVIQPGDRIQINFDHLGTVTGEGGMVNLILFVERAEGELGSPITHIFEPRPMLIDTWSTYSQTFEIPANAVVTGGISFLIESVCGGASGCQVDAYIDNVVLKINP